MVVVVGNMFTGNSKLNVPVQANNLTIADVDFRQRIDPRNQRQLLPNVRPADAARRPLPVCPAAAPAVVERSVCAVPVPVEGAGS